MKYISESGQCPTKYWHNERNIATDLYRTSASFVYTRFHSSTFYCLYCHVAHVKSCKKWSCPFA